MNAPEEKQPFEQTSEQTSGQVPEQLSGQAPEQTPETRSKLSEKANDLVDAVTGEENAKEAVPAKTSGFVEEISEFVGRLYGQAKSVFSRGAETTEEGAEKTGDVAKEGWEDTKEGAEKARDAAEEGINNLEEELRGAADDASKGFDKGVKEAE